ncbi:MAG TPA: O-antigen ligase family protein, partial [Nitrolancea sp.]|nr:O-antigen ligase family protein [Nitrolancea sp.]
LAAALIRTRGDLLRVAGAALAVGCSSGVASIWQHFAKFAAPYAGDLSAAAILTWKGRSLGLAESPVSLANQMVILLAVVIGILACGLGKRRRIRFALIAAFVVLLMGLNFSYTRSAAFGLAPALAAMAFCFRGRRRTTLLAIVVLAVLLFEGLQGTGYIGARYYKSANNDRSAASHEALWTADLAIALQDPFVGIGHKNFEQASAQFANQANTDITVGASALGNERPHNDFLSVWLSWGIFALIAYVAIFVGAIRNFLVAIRHQDLLIRGLAVGGIGALIAYGTNSAFHNSMDSSTLLWLLAGLSVSVARIAAEMTVSRLPKTRGLLAGIS